MILAFNLFFLVPEYTESMFIPDTTSSNNSTAFTNWVESVVLFTLDLSILLATNWRTLSMRWVFDFLSLMKPL